MRERTCHEWRCYTNCIGNCRGQRRSASRTSSLARAPRPGIAPTQWAPLVAPRPVASVQSRKQAGFVSGSTTTLIHGGTPQVTDLRLHFTPLSAKITPLNLATAKTNFNVGHLSKVAILAVSKPVRSDLTLTSAPREKIYVGHLSQVAISAVSKPVRLDLTLTSAPREKIYVGHLSQVAISAVSKPVQSDLTLTSAPREKIYVGHLSQVAILAVSKPVRLELTLTPAPREKIYVGHLSQVAILAVSKPVRLDLTLTPAPREKIYVGRLGQSLYVFNSRTGPIDNQSAPELHCERAATPVAQPRIARCPEIAAATIRLYPAA